MSPGCRMPIFHSELPAAIRSRSRPAWRKPIITELITMSHPVPEHRSLMGRYLRAALYSGLGGSANQVLYGLTPVILARHLGPRNYGIYSLVMALAGIVVAIFSLGQNSALHKLLPEYSTHDSARGGAILANVLLLTIAALIVFCLIFWGLSEMLALQVYRDASLTGVLKFCAPLIFSLASFNLIASAVAGMQDFRSYNLIMMVRNLVLIALVWLGVCLFGLYGAMGGQLIAGFVGLVLMAIRTRRLAAERFPGAVRPRFSQQILKIIFSFILPTLLVTILNIPAYWWAHTLVVRHAGFEQAGLLGVAYTLAQWIMIVPMNLYPSTMTFMSEAWAHEPSEVFSNLVSANLRLMWAMTLPLALGSALLAPVLLRLVFGSAYSAAAPLVFALGFSAVLMVVIGLINTAIAASGRMWHGLGITSGWIVTFIAIGLVYIPKWGAAGGAVTFAASHLFYLAIGYLYLRYFLQVKCEKVGRLAMLTLVGFAAAAPALLTDLGSAMPLLAGLLLLAVITVEWIWVCDEIDRAALRQTLARLISGWRMLYGGFYQ